MAHLRHSPCSEETSATGRDLPPRLSEVNWLLLTLSGRSPYILIRRQCCALPHYEAGVAMNTEKNAGLIRLIVSLFCLGLGIYATRSGYEVVSISEGQLGGGLAMLFGWITVGFGFLIMVVSVIAAGISLVVSAKEANSDDSNPVHARNSESSGPKSTRDSNSSSEKLVYGVVVLMVFLILVLLSIQLNA